ncbi:hypothetical protein ISF35_26095 [Burkholderia pseudomallei]|uniref:hypothetical protein n=1 Tax=Burkholderia pseudomallei TaxID=28450 RepID=UPI0014562E8C|nr:hypothetical protein [Burkholderia pseudomallei]MBF3426238.1 hypothetical protein [Burkholderia pseudomallei]MBF3503812.1 hypothetical protein [Burkholderia pseudomallei]MBF3689923.1 hypothetical protein [Burkholderia pseudomallei]MBF3707951.1 hypothetical protein [Burkholderia pseudomallei]MBF3745941.1 hypothetical protein [Burkholderia pseudomallei]
MATVIATAPARDMPAVQRIYVIDQGPQRVDFRDFRFRRVENRLHAPIELGNARREASIDRIEVRLSGFGDGL